MQAARINLDEISGHKLQDGANTVFVNDQPLALLGSVTSKGVSIVAASATVFAGTATRQVARVSDRASNGHAVNGGSPNVFIGPGPD